MSVGSLHKSEVSALRVSYFPMINSCRNSMWATLFGLLFVYIAVLQNRRDRVVPLHVDGNLMMFAGFRKNKIEA